MRDSSPSQVYVDVGGCPLRVRGHLCASYVTITDKLRNFIGRLHVFRGVTARLFHGFDLRRQDLGGGLLIIHASDLGTLVLLLEG